MILDTHAWVFYATGKPFEKRALRRIEKARSEGRLHIAAVTLWEIALLVGSALHMGVPLATRDAHVIDNAKALGLDVVEI